MATCSAGSYPTDAEVARMQASRSQLSLSHGMKRGRKWVLALATMLVLSQVLVALPNPPSRPVLFVHGWCGSPFDWEPLFGSLLNALPTSMYGYDRTIYIVEYRGTDSSGADTYGFYRDDDPGGNSGAM